MALQYGPSGNQVPWSIASTFVGGVCLPMLSTDALQSTSRRHLLICLVCLFFYMIRDEIGNVTFHQHGSQTKPKQSLGGYIRFCHSIDLFVEPSVTQGSYIPTSLLPGHLAGDHRSYQTSRGRMQTTSDVPNSVKAQSVNPRWNRKRLEF